MSLLFKKKCTKNIVIIKSLKIIEIVKSPENIVIIIVFYRFL
jgi:hypothetical protein